MSFWLKIRQMIKFVGLRIIKKERLINIVNSYNSTLITVRAIRVRKMSIRRSTFFTIKHG